VLIYEQALSGVFPMDIVFETFYLFFVLCYFVQGGYKRYQTIASQKNGFLGWFLAHVSKIAMFGRKCKSSAPLRLCERNSNGTAPKAPTSGGERRQVEKNLDLPPSYAYI
jgi:hypothetical protein